jgi:hypothetical protein
MNLDEVLAYLEAESISRSTLGDGSGVVLDVDRQLVFVLNETGQFVLDALRSGLRNEDDIAAGLAAAFEVDQTEARRDVRALLQDIKQVMLGGRT